jgi:predicted nucleic acid-binding protein
MGRERFHREVLGRIDLTNGGSTNGHRSSAPERGLVDTSIFINAANRPLDIDALPLEVAVSVVTISELRAGVLSATETAARDRRLTTLTGALAMNPVPIDEEIAANWARLRVELRDLDVRMPINDSWVAATAMTLGVAVVTQFDDFPTGLTDLTVVHV